MPISEAQLNANRENSKLSTGPKSPEGKAKLRLNPLTHGFAGQTVVIPDHQKEDYLKLFKSFRTEFKPQGPSEQFLVQSLAEISWSVQQIRAASTNVMTMSGSLYRPIYDAGSPEVNFGLSQANAMEDNLRQINLLGIYEQRKMRLFHSTRKELLQIQAERKAAEKEELETAAPLRQACNSTRQPGQPQWQPAEDGFACSLEQIDRFIARRDRLNSVAAKVNMAS
jgi:hypothetical protein